MLFRLSDVRKSYAGVPVLEGVSFQVNPAEKIGLVGRNGAGKTTIFRLVGKSEEPDSGIIGRMGGLCIGLLDQLVDFSEDETVHSYALSAFAELHRIEADMRRLERQMEEKHSETDLNKYADLQLAFERAGGFSSSAKAESVLLGLGFTSDTWTQRAARLSGGQKNRLAMAKLLLSDADVLLLDEPTNHLDVSAIEWLEEFLRAFKRAFLIISHDRYFLDRTVERIIEIENGKTVSFSGNYSSYIDERDARRKHQEREYLNQQAFIAKNEEFIRRNIAGQKTKQAKSRRNMLERLQRVNAVPHDSSGGNFRQSSVDRAAKNVLVVKDLAIGHETRQVAANISFSLYRGDRLGIVGPNGTGKTTLLKTLTGSIPPIVGEIIWGTKTSIGYYSQDLTDLGAERDIMQELRRVAPLADGGSLRGFLARFLFFGDDVFKKVGDLSGGERGRLALAKLIYSRKNVLILDEPTNHLDIPSREALEGALDDFTGTIIAVSHDRFFLDKIVGRILAFDSGRIDLFDGNYTAYHEWKNAARSTAANDGSAVVAPYELTASALAHFPETLESGRSVPLSKNERVRLEKRIAAIENEISICEEEAEQIALEMTLPDVAADFNRLGQLTKHLADNEERRKRLYDDWQSAAQLLL